MSNTDSSENGHEAPRIQPKSRKKRKTPQRAGDGSISRRTDGRWAASILMPDENGWEKRAQTTKSTEQEALHWIETMKDRRDRLGHLNLSRDTEDGQHVYFIQALSGGPIKIGTTTNMSYRFKIFQAHSPVPLRIVHFIENGGKQLERDLHHRFRHWRLWGEWFENTEKLMLFIEKDRERENAGHTLGEHRFDPLPPEVTDS